MSALEDWKDPLGCRHVSLAEDVVSELEQQNADLQRRLDLAHEGMAKRTAGECTCPKSKGSDSHFPGCPMIDKNRIAELEAASETKYQENLYKFSAMAMQGFIACRQTDHKTTAKESVMYARSLLLELELEDQRSTLWEEGDIQ